MDTLLATARSSVALSLLTQDLKSILERAELDEKLIEGLLSNPRRWAELREVAPHIISPILRRLVVQDGSFPRDAKQGDEQFIYGPAITLDNDGTYSVHNCCFFVLSNDATGRKRARKSLELDEAVRLFLIAEPFGNNRGYAWAPQYWTSRESG